MRLFVGIILGCYITLFILMGLGLMAFSLQWVSIEGAVWWLQEAYQQRNLRLGCFLTGLGLGIINYLIARFLLIKVQQQKTIAFENSDGHVTVSLSAIEDFIRQATREIPEVKKLRSDVIAGKGGIRIQARVTLWPDARIPESAERIQALVKTRVQEMLSGIEEPIQVSVHVAEIAHREDAAKASGRRDDQINTRFRGF